MQTGRSDMVRTRTGAALLAAGLLALLSACGGDALTLAGGGIDGTGSPAQFSEGVMTRGSVILNGVRYDDSQAVVRIDDRTAAAAELATGMFVRLRGRVNADGSTGTAERVEVRNEVRGAISAIDASAQPASFVVVGQKVLIDDATVYANVAGLAGLGVGSRVEVHGPRDANGAIRASRVELTDAATIDELRGVVSDLGAATFRLGGISVSFAGAAVSPAGARIANGQPVEVRGSFNAAAGVFLATRVDREDLEDEQVRPAAGQKLEVEGYIAGLDAAVGTFVVNGRTVRYSGSTRFEGGSVVDLANNVRVEAEGTVDAAGVLQAARIELRQSRVTLKGLASTVDAAGGRLTALGLSVRIDSLSEVRAVDASGRDSTRLADIVAGADRVEVRGRLDPSGTLVAERIEETDDRDDELRGRVDAKDEAARTLVILGVRVSLASAELRGRDEAPVSAAAFFAAIAPASATAAGTTVEVKGVFAGGILVAEEAELKN
jgi:hypothetical protein